MARTHDFDAAWKSILEAFEVELVELLFPELHEDILIYNFRTIDVEKINFEEISEDNPLKLVFKMAKRLLEIGASDEEIFEAKIKLAEELKGYDKVKTTDQIKALVDFLEYLFLIDNNELEKRFEEYKNRSGGAFKMTIEEIRKIHYKQQGREEGIKEGIKEEKKEIARKLLIKGAEIDLIIELTNLTREEIEVIRKEISS